MNILEYIPQAIRTEAPTENFVKALIQPKGGDWSKVDLNNEEIRIIHAIMGFVTETGELMTNLDEAGSPGKMDKTNVFEEVGDCFWYAAIYIDARRKQDMIMSSLAGRNDLLADTSKVRVRKTLRNMSVTTAAMLDQVKKYMAYGKPFNFDDLDPLFAEFYDDMLRLCIRFNFKAAEIRTQNIAKLQARYPHKFTSEAAINRDTDVELDAMGRDR